MKLETTDMTRTARYRMLGAAIVGAALLWPSGLSVSGASARDRAPVADGEGALLQAAGRGPVDLPDGTWYDASTGTVRTDALEEDATALGTAQGISLDQALALLRAQERMETVLVEAQNLYPELVGIRWVDGRVVAQFNGEAPQGAQDLLSSAGAQVAYESVGHSARDLQQFETDLAKALETMGIANYVVSIDPSGQRIIASVSRANGARLADGSIISVQSIWSRLPSQLAEANVDVQVADGPVAQATTTYGGTEARVGTSFICTNGFTVSSGIADGIATAGHCGSGLNSYRDWVTGITHTMTFQAMHHDGPWGDFEWFTTNGTEVDDFYTQGGSRRDVTGVKVTMNQGDGLSWYGRSTQTDWSSSVQYPDVDTSGPKNLACLYDYHVVGGDSGGPVYINGLAAGFVWGWVLIDGARRDCFSQARYIDDALGLGIKW
jgi:hypothetical protein